MKQLFKSYFQGGFECAYSLVENQKKLDILAVTKHDEYCRADYKLLKDLNILTVREGLAWSQIDQGNGKYDFERFEKMMKIAKEEGIQQVWDLNHFDYPSYLDPFSDEFVDAFGEYAKRAIEVIRKYDDSTLIICPINEISFFSWIGGDMGWWAPYTIDRGKEFKQNLVKAALRSIDEIRKIDKNVKFMHVDPITRRVAYDKKDSELVRKEEGFFRAKLEAWDMIIGKLKPELGGDPSYFDIIGANYYLYNQEFIKKNIVSGEIEYPGMKWYSKHRVSMKEMLKELYDRYKKPIVISETGCWGTMRKRWWDRTFTELFESLDANLPILGICAYPVIDRPDWVLGHLTNSGLWDFEVDDKTLERRPHEITINIVKRNMKKLKNEYGIK